LLGKSSDSRGEIRLTIMYADIPPPTPNNNMFDCHQYYKCDEPNRYPMTSYYRILVYKLFEYENPQSMKRKGAEGDSMKVYLFISYYIV
jgi:hypothetical protein